MSNKTQLQTNNTDLDALIARVNAAKDTASSLPDAGSGGSGGGSVETCTVTIQANYRTYVFLTVYSNGYITVESVPVDAGNVVTVENVVKNSMMACIFMYYTNARYELYSYQPVNIDNVDTGINWAMFKVWDNGDGDNCSCYLTWEKC